MQPGTRAWLEAGGTLARYSVGVIPNMRLKLVVKEPTPWRPTSRQISATE